MGASVYWFQQCPTAAVYPFWNLPEAKLSFAFGEYSRPCYRTSYSTNWIRSWSGADIGSPDRRTTATFTSAVGEPANE